MQRLNKRGINLSEYHYFNNYEDERFLSANWKRSPLKPGPITWSKSFQLEDEQGVLPAAVSLRGGVLTVEAAGYGNCNGGGPIGQGNQVILALQLQEGQLRALVWPDIRKEAPSPIIPLESARETCRE